MSRDHRSGKDSTPDATGATGAGPGKQTLVERIAPDPKRTGATGKRPSADDSDEDPAPGTATLVDGADRAPTEAASMAAEDPAGATSRGAEPGARPVASDLQAAATAGPASTDADLVINRKAASADSIEGQHAGAVVGQAQARSTGAALDPAVRADMEAGFETDFSKVRIHTGADAADAARGVNARAFTVGSDIYFDQGGYAPGTPEGKHLLAHELAHVAQGGGPAAKASGDGMSVSSPGDAHEVEADAAASAVVSGGQAGPLGSAAPGIHRDALGDLDATSRGNWIGNVDEGEAIRRVGALTDAEKRRFATEEGFRATIRRLVGAFDAGEMVRFFSAAVHFNVRWKIYWLITSGAIDGLDQAQWRRVIGTASPADMDELRAYEAGYRAFVVNGPADLVPPWDRLQALKRGWWTGDAAAIRFAVNQLSAAQRATVRDDHTLTRAIVTRAGTGAETFRVVTYLNLPLKWAVHWLDQAGKLAELTPQHWSQLLGEAPKAEFDELVGWADMWTLAQRHCPPAVLQVVRQNTADPTTITTQLQDPVALGLLWTSLGAAGLLGLVTQAGTDVAVNYNHLKAASNKHLDVINGLERGMRQGERTSANLKKWFDPATGESVISTLELMASVRFGTTVGGTGGPGQSAAGGVHASKPISPWTAEGLRKAWQIMERMPPGQIESNPALLHLLRQSGSNGGYYAGRDTSAGWDNSAVIGLAGPTGAVMSGDAVYGGTMPKFNETLRHELGHAVDNQLTIMAAVQGEAWAGAWQNHGTPTAWVDAMIAAGGGLNAHGYPASDIGDYRAAMIRAATNGTLFLTELNAIRAAKSPAQPPVAAAPTTGPVSVLNNLATWHHSSAFWSANAWQPQNERNFVRGYGDANHWWSFANAKLAQKATNYQFRAPKEWFADAYAVYYAEQEAGPDVPVGGLLRSKDPDAANFMATQIDRSHSPQIMAGAATPGAGPRPAPGTAGGVGGAP
ncbi:MAG: DUF4157 domain-containing protein [Myxococcota bacterium]|nr:DUF4157 domain-containing protein [Myxococcota bacterium]